MRGNSQIYLMLFVKKMVKYYRIMTFKTWNNFDNVISSTIKIIDIPALSLTIVFCFKIVLPIS